MKKVSKNFLSLFLSDGATRIIGFVATVYVARMLAVEGFGLIHYGLAFISYALLIANPGLTIIGAREVAKEPQDSRFIEQTCGLRIALAVLIFVVFIIGTVALPGDAPAKRVIVVYAMALFPFAFLLEFVFQGREEMEYIGVGRIIQYIIYLALLLLFLERDADIVVVPIAYVAGYVAGAAFLIAVYIRRYRSFRLRFSISRWREILSMSIPVGLAVTLNQVTISLPPIVLGIFRTNYEVGIFSAANKIIFTFLIIERVFYYVFFPIFSRQHEQQPERLESSFNFLTRLLFAVTVPTAIGGMMLAPGIIAIIYGQPFMEATGVLRILLLYFMIVPLNTIFGYGLIAIDQEKRFSRIIIITATISAVLITLLGLRFGFYGTAVALLVSESVSIVLMNRQLRKFVRFGKMAYILRPLVAGIIMAIALHMLQVLHVLVLVILGIMVYLAAFYVVKGYSGSDLQNLKAMLTGR